MENELQNTESSIENSPQKSKWLTPKRKRTLIIGFIILILFCLYWFHFRKKWAKQKENEENSLAKKIQDSKEEKTDKKKTEQELIDEVKADSNFPLKVGKEGQRVEQLQKWLKEEKNAELPKYGVDRRFYHETLAALQKATGKDFVSKDFFIEQKMYKY